jgi:hypothetical protein
VQQRPHPGDLLAVGDGVARRVLDPRYPLGRGGQPHRQIVADELRVGAPREQLPQPRQRHVGVAAGQVDRGDTQFGQDRGAVPVGQVVVSAQRVVPVPGPLERLGQVVAVAHVVRVQLQRPLRLEHRVVEAAQPRVGTGQNAPQLGRPVGAAGRLLGRAGRGAEVVHLDRPAGEVEPPFRRAGGVPVEAARQGRRGQPLVVLAATARVEQFLAGLFDLLQLALGLLPLLQLRAGGLLGPGADGPLDRLLDLLGRGAAGDAQQRVVVDKGLRHLQAPVPVRATSHRRVTDCRASVKPIATVDGEAMNRPFTGHLRPEPRVDHGPIGVS